MLASGGRVFHMSKDHIVDAEAERRILHRGGDVQTFTISGISARRVCMKGSQFPGLAMSRALGDSVAQSLGVSSEPEVHVGIPFSHGSALVVASDGVWERMDAQEVARRVRGAQDPQAAAESLVEAARAQWPQEGNIDDITAVVLTATP
uniref:PPM-type phosphatase domain-containing protein n=1 Tax=Alexandrium catenella TaxID=2925 RepID=A0A7S1MFI2_ALECA